VPASAPLRLHGRRAFGCNKFECLTHCVIRLKVVDQDLGDLASCNYAIAGIAGLARVALQEDKRSASGSSASTPI